MDKETPNAKVILDAGAAIAAVRRAEEADREFIVIPDGYRLEDFDSLLDNPRRQRADVQVTEVDSLIRYIKKFAGATSQVFAAVDAERAVIVLTAILDYHEGKNGTPGWGRHRVTFRATPSQEWKTWQAQDKKRVSQSAFAQFIEDNLNDIVFPAGGVMLEIAKTLEAKTSVDFKSGIRLENGDHHLKYVTETTGRAGGNGDLEIPGQFEIGIAPFLGGPAYKIKARLRYRIEEGHLTLWYELVQPHKVIEDAAKEIIATLKTETDAEPFMGAAPALS